MPHSQAFSHRVVVTTALIGLGLALRLPGLALNGIADVFQMILDWGFDVVGLGHAGGFDINYGILSYAVFGWAADLSEAMPRFWWAPYKGIVIVAEAIVLAALMALVPRSRRRAVLCLYWLNPWFILHGAYQGFWEGGYLLCGLLAVLGVGRIRDRRQAWAAVGVLLMASGMFKPQGLVYFVGPVGLFLGVEYLRGRREPLVAYLVGVTRPARYHGAIDLDGRRIGSRDPSQLRVQLFDDGQPVERRTEHLAHAVVHRDAGHRAGRGGL